MPAAKVAAKATKKSGSFTIDVTQPVTDEIFDIAAFETFLNARIKVGGKTGKLAGKVTITRDGSKINVGTEVAFQKRYLKYLTKKFLKKSQLRDYLRVVSSGKGTYDVRYYGVDNDAEAAE